jgi:stage V sporulation protein D (sporulation-specific penicillin-binding protein)
MPTDESLNRRLTVLSMILISISGILLIRLLSFQFRMDPEVKQRLEANAESRYSQTVEVEPNRGQIYDRNGNLLAANTYEYRVGISPNQVTDRQETARVLAPLVGMPEDEIYRALLPDQNGVYSQYVLLASLVDFETGQAIADLDIDGIVIDALPARIYPQGALTAQIVGFFRGADDAKTKRGYGGVEGYYQSLLAGQTRRVTTSYIPGLAES